MSDIAYFEIYNVISKERAILPIDKGSDKATTARMFELQYGRDGWVLVGPLQHEGGDLISMLKESAKEAKCEAFDMEEEE